MAWNAYISQTAVLYFYRANAFHRDAAKRNRDGAQRMALCFTHEAMLFSTQNIHLEKSLHYLISFSFHTIPKGNHLPIHIQKLMRQVSLYCHNHLRCKLVRQPRKILQVSLQSDESGCRELCTLGILYLFHGQEVMRHFLQARKVFQ